MIHGSYVFQQLFEQYQSSLIGNSWFVETYNFGKKSGFRRSGLSEIVAYGSKKIYNYFFQPFEFLSLNSCKIEFFTAKS